MTKILPTFQITPSMAIHFARKQHLQVTREQAEQWLVRNRREIERRLKPLADELVENILADVTLWEWPDPAFNKAYRLIEDAIDGAAYDYAERSSLQFSSASLNEDEMHRLTRAFLAHTGREPNNQLTAVRLSFAPAGADLLRNWPEDSYKCKLVYEDGGVVASIQGTPASLS